MDVSIVIPVYNGSATIKQTLAALIAQDFQGSQEIIVVDDGSTDDTKTLVKSFQQVKLLEQNHQGPAAARNQGAKKAQGQVVVFTDADCLADKSMIKHLFQAFQEAPGLAGVQGSYQTKQKGLVARFVQLEIEKRYEKMKQKQLIDFIGTYCCAYDRKIFLKAGGFDQTFATASGEDPELSYRLASQGFKLVFRPEAFCFHQHPDSLMKYLKTKFYRAYWRVPLYGKHKQKMIKDSYTPKSLKLQIGLVYSLIPAVISAFFHPLGLWAAAALIALLVLLLLLESLFYLKKNLFVGLSAPFIILMRTLSFCLGLPAGVLRGLK